MSYSVKISSFITVPATCLVFFIALLIPAQAWSEPLKVAFIGDQGVGADSRDVLSLVANEGTDLLMILGDLGYKDNTADIWEQNLNDILGSEFPILTLVGNHENYEWPRYQKYIQQRIDRVAGLSCSGNTGVKALCSYGNIEVVQVAPAMYEVPGVNGDDNYADFIRSSFGDSSNRWRICSWHKPHEKVQTGKKNGPGWEVYDACLDAGAMVANAHEHAYSRTHLLSSFRDQTVVHQGSQMALQPGQSFAFVSGLGGYEVRGQARGGDVFASIYTADQGATHGALFCTFEDRTADCYFKAIDGAVPDQFSLTRSGVSLQDISPPPPVSTAAPSNPAGQGYVFSRTDKSEYRWIDRDASGQLGSVWIDQACAARLGGARASGRWSELMRIAPGLDTIDSPCTGSSGSSMVSATSGTATSGTSASGSTGLSGTPGYVFSRSDKEEYRWIDTAAGGVLGSVWIDKACAQGLGGPRASGDWKTLMQLAPAFDAIDSPCQGLGSQSQTAAAGSLTAGFAYARTDKSEYRWIDRDASGRLGSIWIDKACADRLGGAKRSGDWKALMSLAPGFDTIAYPCDNS